LTAPAISFFISAQFPKFAACRGYVKMLKHKIITPLLMFILCSKIRALLIDKCVERRAAFETEVDIQRGSSGAY
jgi:hypothetical protein